MTTFGQNPGFNSYHFSGANTLNQEGIAAVTIVAPGRVTDLNVFWDGDGVSVAGANCMWNNGGGLEIQSAGYSSGVGIENTGSQSLHTTSHSYFFSSTHNVNVGFFRTKNQSSVVSVNTGGVDGITLTTAGNAAQSMAGASSFSFQYGGLGQGAMRAYGNYVPGAVFVKRGGTWTSVPVNLKRSGAMSAVAVWVRRAGAWVRLAMVPVNDWASAIEQQIRILWSDGSVEYGIYREGELGIVTFGNYDPKDEPQSKHIYTVRFA
jgi:hypothetical protein